MEIKYSDGKDIEEYILQILQTAEDKSSSSKIGEEYYSSWPIRYHLSPERSNLIRHLNFSGLEVLEIGAGMGALSRYMAEECNSLSVIEGTQSRYRCLEERLKGLKNWDGEISNFEDTTPKKKYDLICLYGVFEYSELYITPDNKKNAFTTFLNKLDSYLKKDGVLLIAIENKIGLKYWNGAPEDHSGKLYDGISGYPLTESAKTFSAFELTKLLKANHYEDIKNFYPFPDYKLVKTVIGSDLITEFPHFAADIMGLTCSSLHATVPRLNHFPEHLAFQTLAQSNTLEHFPNSLLFASSRTQNSEIMQSLMSKTEDKCCWYYSPKRRLASTTTFRIDENQQLLVSKTSDYTQNKIHDNNAELQVTWNGVQESKVQHESQLRNTLANLLYYKDDKLFYTTFLDFLRWAIIELQDPENSSVLCPQAVDAIFMNTVCAGDNYIFYDLEWHIEGGVRKSWYILRNILALEEFCHPTSNSIFRSYSELYNKICKDLDIKSDVKKDVHLDSTFQNLVTDISYEEYKIVSYQILEKTLPANVYPQSVFTEKDAEHYKKYSDSLLVKLSLRIARSIERRPIISALSRIIRSRILKIWHRK